MKYKDMFLYSLIVNLVFESQSSVKHMNKEVFTFGGGHISTQMKIIGPNEDLIKIVQYTENVYRMLEAGVELNADAVHNEDRISFFSWTGDDVGLLDQWVSSVVYVEAKLKKYGGNL